MIRAVSLRGNSSSTNRGSFLYLSLLIFTYNLKLTTNTRLSHQRHSASLRPSHTALPLAHLDLQHVGQGSDAARDLLFVQAGKSQAQRVRQGALNVEVAPRSKEHAALFHV